MRIVFKRYMMRVRLVLYSTLWHTPTVVLLIEKGHNMNISPIALKIWAVHNSTSRITTRKSFHDTWKTEDEFLAMMSDIPNIDDVVHELSVVVDDMGLDGWCGMLL